MSFPALQQWIKIHKQATALQPSKFWHLLPLFGTPVSISFCLWHFVDWNPILLSASAAKSHFSPAPAQSPRVSLSTFTFGSENPNQSISCPVTVHWWEELSARGFWNDTWCYPIIWGGNQTGSYLKIRELPFWSLFENILVIFYSRQKLNWIKVHIKHETLHLFSGLDVFVKLLKLTRKDYLLRKVLPRNGSHLVPAAFPRCHDSLGNSRNSGSPPDQIDQNDQND